MMQHWFTEEGKLNSEKESRRFQTTRTSQRDHAFSKGSGIVLDDEDPHATDAKTDREDGISPSTALSWRPDNSGPQDLESR